MSLRKFMHPKNKYKIEPNFQELARLYPEFHKHVYTDLSGKLKFNFKNQESLRVLAKILLKHDFNIDVDIPSENLVPVLPLRLNYILWIQDIFEHGNVRDNICGIDIGTGAVCIYPLLCAKLYGWKMLGTEIDPSSVSSANENVKRNNFDNLITVIRVEENTIFNQSLINNNNYLFTMCNPPFFDNEEITEKKIKKLPPRNASTGNNNELFVDGGERKFVMNIVNESIKLSTSVKIYTTMLGQKSSLSYFRNVFKNKNIDNFTWTEFCQGYTKRWGLAWTFLQKDIFNLTTAPVIRTREQLSRKKLKNEFSVEFTFPLGDKWKDFDEIITSFKQWIHELNMEIEELELDDEDIDGWACHLKTCEDSWSHARRKRRLAMREASSPKKPCLENLKINNNIPTHPLTNNLSTVETNNNPVKKEIYLDCSVTIAEINTDSQSIDNVNNNIRINLILQGGTSGKIGLETFRQYLINKFDVRDYIHQQNRMKLSTKKKDKKTKKFKGSL